MRQGIFYQKKCKKIRYIHNEYLGKFYNPVPLICLSLINLSDTEGMRYWQLSFGFNGREGCVCLEEKAYCYVSNVGTVDRVLNRHSYLSRSTRSRPEKRKTMTLPPSDTAG